MTKPRNKKNLHKLKAKDYQNNQKSWGEYLHSLPIGEQLRAQNEFKNWIKGRKR